MPNPKPKALKNQVKDLLFFYLLPHQPVQVSPIPDAKFRHNPVLQQPVVQGACHGLVPVEGQAKSPISPD